MIRVPAEWEAQSRVWIAWPHNLETWPGCFEGIPDLFREFIRRCASSVPVHVLGRADLRSQAKLDEIENTFWHDIATNDAWVRDYGPTFVVDENGKRYAIDWRYNAWGGKYPPWDADNAAAPLIAKQSDWPVVESSLCIEGGAMEWDGTGRLLTSSGCLITKNRNPGWTHDQVETHLRELAGLREIVWVDGGGLAGDDTDGHIDQLARFIDAENIVVAVCDPSDTENYLGLERNFELLQTWGQSTRPNVKVHRLPLPPRREIRGQRVPESYCNFVRLGAQRTLVPTFGHSDSDQRAIDVIQRLMHRTQPQCQVEGIDCRALVWGLGALHCASLNEPATPRFPSIN